jgi:hypothetical protein
MKEARSTRISRIDRLRMASAPLLAALPLAARGLPLLLLPAAELLPAAARKNRV